MKKSVLILAGAAMLLSSCGSVPITGRKQLNLVSDSEVLQSSLSQYKNYMSSATISGEQAQSEQVTRVGKKLAAATEAYLKATGLESEISNFQWEFNLVKNDEINAFCMPGGKIVVYEGLLPYTQNETGLAIVLGHEIAHAVAKHSAEQLTKQQNQQTGTSILGTVLNQTVGNGVGNVASAVAGQYFSFRNLKYSRDNETEADYMGLIFAAMAGYDPQQAIPFWKRMSQGSSSNQSDIFSDHPSDAKRIAALQKEMPTALKYYKPQKTYKVGSTSKTSTTKKTSRKKKTTTRRK